MSVVPWPEPFEFECEACSLKLTAPNRASILQRICAHELAQHPDMRERRVLALIDLVGLERVHGLTVDERRRYETISKGRAA